MSSRTTRRTYTIKEAAALTGLPASTLRYYESIGVVPPMCGASSKHRVYDEDDLDQLTWVACLAATGMSVSDMRHYVANGPLGPAARHRRGRRGHRCRPGQRGVRARARLRRALPLRDRHRDPRLRDPPSRRSGSAWRSGICTHAQDGGHAEQPRTWVLQDGGVRQTLIRDAIPDDAAACAAIYGAYVAETPATFETEPPTVEEVERRMAGCQAGHAWLVAEQDGRVTGFAYGTRWAERPAYRWACEVSVYLDRSTVGAGVGTSLYSVLLDRLTERGFHVAFAKVAQPNDASNALHERFGFRRVGLLERVGHKLGAWHDVAILQRDLVPVGVTPEEPR